MGRLLGGALVRFKVLITCRNQSSFDFQIPGIPEWEENIGFGLLKGGTPPPTCDDVGRIIEITIPENIARQRYRYNDNPTGVKLEPPPPSKPMAPIRCAYCTWTTRLVKTKDENVSIRTCDKCGMQEIKKDVLTEIWEPLSPPTKQPSAPIEAPKDEFDGVPWVDVNEAVRLLRADQSLPARLRPDRKAIYADCHARVAGTRIESAHKFRICVPQYRQTLVERSEHYAV